MQVGITSDQNCKPDSVRSNYPPDTCPKITGSCGDVNLNKSDIILVTLRILAQIIQVQMKGDEAKNICARNRVHLAKRLKSKLKKKRKKAEENFH